MLLRIAIIKKKYFFINCLLPLVIFVIFIPGAKIDECKIVLKIQPKYTYVFAAALNVSAAPPTTCEKIAYTDTILYASRALASGYESLIFVLTGKVYDRTTIQSMGLQRSWIIL